LDPKKLGITSRVRSFVCALEGLAAVLKSQPNTWYMALASGVVAGAGLWFGVTAPEWCFLASAIAVVWIAEILNSSIEFLVDLASPGHHPLAKKAKDAAAAASLVAVLFSLVIAGLVFLPRVLDLLDGR